MHFGNIPHGTDFERLYGLSGVLKSQSVVVLYFEIKNGQVSIEFVCEFCCFQNMSWYFLFIENCLLVRSCCSYINNFYVVIYYL